VREEEERKGMHLFSEIINLWLQRLLWGVTQRLFRINKLLPPVVSRFHCCVCEEIEEETSIVAIALDQGAGIDFCDD
jgi:hypothetical protein